MLAQVKMCHPISYCGVPFLTTTALELEAYNSVDKRELSWLEEREESVNISRGSEALTVLLLQQVQEEWSRHGQLLT